MRAFHNDEKIKQKYIERIKTHALADEIIKGKYWKNGKGCAVGCTIHNSKHENYEIELGIPKILAILEDKIFENLPNQLAKQWPLQFLESIKVGADLSKVWPKFAIFLLINTTQCNYRHPQCKIVADNFQNELNGQKIDWISVKHTAYAADATTASAAASAYAADYAADYAASAADAAAASAADAAAASASAADAYAYAYAYAEAASASAAEAEADAYAYAAEDAAEAAAEAAAEDAAEDARQRAYIEQSKKLLELLSECE